MTYGSTTEDTEKKIEIILCDLCFLCGYKMN